MYSRAASGQTDTGQQIVSTIADIEADVVVCGAGIAGLVAARTAQEAGAKITLLEKADAAGGSAALSAGVLWTASNLEAWLSVQPGGNPALGEALVATFPQAVDWLRSQGVEVEPFEFDTNGWQPSFAYIAYRLTPSATSENARAAMTVLVDKLTDNGADIHLNTAARSFHQDIDGQITGVEAVGPGGRIHVSARATIMGTGGFQGNPELRARYLGPFSDQMVLRGNPHSTGEGFQAALAVGAGQSGPFSRFYGHRVPAPPAEVGFHNFTKVHLGGALPGSIVVNKHGRRFADETLGDEVTVHDIPHQPDALAFLVYDDCDARRDAARSDAVGNVRKAGGEILKATTLENLAQVMAERWGVARDSMLDELHDYNVAARAGDQHMLATPRCRDLRELTEPPFHAIKFLPGITFTYGGVLINAQAQVLDSRGHPLAGLFAAGADAGGIYTFGYTGGLSLGLSFGRIAGQQAAAVALTT